MSKFDRLMTNNIGTASFSITIVTHYRPRSKVYANGIFSWQIKSHNYTIIQNKTYRTFKGSVSNVYWKYKEISACGYWNMSFKGELITMTETSTFKCILPLDKWSHYYVVFVMIKKRTIFIYLIITKL